MIVLLVMVTMLLLAAHFLAHAKLEREVAVMIVNAKGSWFVEKIIANCSIQARTQVWIVVLVRY